MENREQQILSEIKSMMASIRSQLERLDAKMAELQQVVDPEEFDMAPIDIDIEETVHEEPVQTVEVQEIPMEVEEPEEEVIEESVEEVADLPEEEPEAIEPEDEPVEETEPESEPELESAVEPELWRLEVTSFGACALRTGSCQQDKPPQGEAWRHD